MRGRGGCALGACFPMHMLHASASLQSAILALPCKAQGAVLVLVQILGSPKPPGSEACRLKWAFAFQISALRICRRIPELGWMSSSFYASAARNFAFGKAAS
ncbi:unnamed protein product [Effrenium voratum]|uniref:Secreted protein n=1 Tax=Effrenium voratum TaxID=2562239 RepID=A0AA36IK42_9DINO|nr:unnamed protein product [Effrenium voratum]